MHLLILTKIYFNLLTYFRSMESSKLNQSCSIQAFCPLLLKKLSLNMKLTNEKRFFEKKIRQIFFINFVETFQVKNKKF